MILHCIDKQGREFNVDLPDTTRLAFESRETNHRRRFHVDCFSYRGGKKRVNVKVPFRAKVKLA